MTDTDDTDATTGTTTRTQDLQDHDVIVLRDGKRARFAFQKRNGNAIHFLAYLRDDAGRETGEARNVVSRRRTLWQVAGFHEPANHDAPSTFDLQGRDIVHAMSRAHGYAILSKRTVYVTEPTIGCFVASYVMGDTTTVAVDPDGTAYRARCLICGQPRQAPYRFRNSDGQIVRGCVDRSHDRYLSGSDLEHTQTPQALQARASIAEWDREILEDMPDTTPVQRLFRTIAHDTYQVGSDVPGVSTDRLKLPGSVPGTH